MGPLETRQAMLTNGYEPLPLAGKAPILNGWQAAAINDEAILAWQELGPNTGMRTARVPALDVDILDPGGARAAQDTLRQLLEGRGRILERVGQYPKFAILLRTDTPFKKIIRKFRDKSGVVHKIEVLGDGQQIAVAGIHPDTKEPFRWRGGLSPVNTPRSELPAIDDGEIHAILDLIAGELRSQLGWLEADGSQAVDANGDAIYVPITDRIEKMQYGGEYPINDTLLAYSGERLRNGIPCNDLIEDCMARAHRAYEEIPGDPQERPIWDWTKMRHQIEAMVYGYIEKNHKDEPRLIDTLPAGMLEKWLKIEKLGGKPSFRKRRHWGVEDTPGRSVADNGRAATCCTNRRED
jgi:Bifunctional DNA primase/polymerase, N-terminal